MIEAARHFQSAGFPKPVCVVVHAIFADQSYASLQTVASRIVSTNSVRHPSAEISIAPLLVETGKANTAPSGRTEDRQELLAVSPKGTKPRICGSSREGETVRLNGKADPTRHPGRSASAGRALPVEGSRHFF